LNVVRKEREGMREKEGERRDPEIEILQHPTNFKEPIASAFFFLNLSSEKIKNSQENQSAKRQRQKMHNNFDSLMCF
jgi:hypothetical protein